MNDFQTQLFNDLQTLSGMEDDAFYSKVFTMDNAIYKVFNYRLASYSNFILPNARECRGSMFEIDAQGNPVRLVCLMPQKFFNYGENPISMGLTINADTVDSVMDKVDGSIISTFIHEGQLRLKSKTSISSEHVLVATEWLDHPANADLKTELFNLTKLHGLSVHMELTSPLLRIVIGYEKVSLTILGARYIDTGALVTKAAKVSLLESYPTAAAHWVSELPINITNVDDFVAHVKNMFGIEGFVIRFKDGEHVKIKTDWYCALHHTKDSIGSPRRLFECIINEAIDDLKAMFIADRITMDRIEAMEAKVVPLYNRMIHDVEQFYTTNKGLDRKSFAIKSTKELPDYLGLVMNLYLNRENDYKAFAIKWPNKFGVDGKAVYAEMVE